MLLKSCNIINYPNTLNDDWATERLETLNSENNDPSTNLTGGENPLMTVQRFITESFISLFCRLDTTEILINTCKRQKTNG